MAEEDMKNIEEEKNREPNNSQHIDIKYTENHKGPNSNDQNILDSNDVDRNTKSGKTLFDNAHVDGDMVSYSQIISEEDIINFDEAIRSHNQTVSNGNGKENDIYVTISNPSHILSDDDETTRNLNQTISEDNDDDDGSEDDDDSSEDTFDDDDDDDSSEDNNDDSDSSEDNDDDDSSEHNKDDDDSSDDNYYGDQKNTSTLSENISDDETMSYSNQAVSIDHINETVNTEHESSRDGIIEGGIYDDDAEEDDEIEDETYQCSHNDFKDDDLDHAKKLCVNTKLSRDKLELLVPERDSLTSDQSFMGGDLMSSNQDSFDDTKVTDHTHDHDNTNSSIVSTAAETSKEKTIEISLVKLAHVQIKESKQSDQNQDKFQDYENNNTDKMDDIVEPKQVDQNQDNENNDIDKIDHIMAEEDEKKKVKEFNDNDKVDHIVAQSNEINKLIEDNGKVDHIVAEANETNKLIEDNGKVNHIVAQASETNKLIEDNGKVDHIVAEASETNKLSEDNGNGEDEKLHTSDMRVLTDSISSSDQKAMRVINQAKTFSGYVHQRKRPIREEGQEEHMQYEYETHHLNHDLYHVPQFGDDDARKESKNTNNTLRSDMEVQTDNVDTYPEADVHESRTIEVQTDNVHESRTMEVQTDIIDTYPVANVHESRTMEVQTDYIDTYPVANVHESRTLEVQTDTYPLANVQESRTTCKRFRLSNSSPKPLATVTIDIYSPGRTYYS
ncbi:uncharacterized protein LOC131074982 [Cryptomeria japonica]|uniref:uncharacterized protein LOC131074982 n=1 Tax=Cryptomeria japonica TaxID=3369 RepID=UPI0027DAB356|nr:uncharacterized protein LOC131074982 [Cryptomeria japonica]